MATLATFKKERPEFNSQVFAEIREVTNPDRPHFGKVKIVTDMHDNTILDHPEYSDYMPLGTAETVLHQTGFQKV